MRRCFFSQADGLTVTHLYYTTRRINPLKKMQSLMAVACKLIRIFYAMLTKQVDYDPQKMLSDIRRPEIYLQAA